MHNPVFWQGEALQTLKLPRFAIPMHLGVTAASEAKCNRGLFTTYALVELFLRGICIKH